MKKKSKYMRQVLNEFKSNNGIDIIVKINNNIKVYTIDELLPESFSL